jgi:hypothetical protein
MENQAYAEVVVEMSALPPRWVDIVEEIEDMFKVIKEKSSFILK